jgi:hypothetical protein
MNDLLDSAVAAHGGLDRWNQVKSITVDAAITGAIWALKNQGDALKDVRFEVDTTRERLTMDFAGQDKRSVFEPHRVVMQRSDGALTGEALWTYLCAGTKPLDPTSWTAVSVPRALFPGQRFDDDRAVRRSEPGEIPWIGRLDHTAARLDGNRHRVGVGEKSGPHVCLGEKRPDKPREGPVGIAEQQPIPRLPGEQRVQSLITPSATVELCQRPGRDRDVAA